MLSVKIVGQNGLSANITSVNLHLTSQSITQPACHFGPLILLVAATRALVALMLIFCKRICLEQSSTVRYLSLLIDHSTIDPALVGYITVGQITVGQVVFGRKRRSQKKVELEFSILNLCLENVTNL
jgi:hypothetical protein